MEQMTQANEQQLEQKKLLKRIIQSLLDLSTRL